MATPSPSNVSFCAFVSLFGAELGIYRGKCKHTSTSIDGGHVLTFPELPGFNMRSAPSATTAGAGPCCLGPTMRVHTRSWTDPGMVLLHVHGDCSANPSAHGVHNSEHSYANHPHDARCQRSIHAHLVIRPATRWALTVSPCRVSVVSSIVSSHVLLSTQTLSDVGLGPTAMYSEAVQSTVATHVVSWAAATRCW